MINEEGCEEYEGSPKFDEDPTELVEDWKNEEILVTALGYNDLICKQPLKFEGIAN